MFRQTQAKIKLLANLVKPKPNLKTFGTRSFAYAAPDVWNNLPDDVKSSETICIFKKRLKTHLFKYCFPSF